MTMTVPTIPLSPRGPHLSSIVYGTWRLLDDTPTAPSLAARFSACAAMGISSVDTAEIYGGYGVEAAIGAALRCEPALRESLQIITKAGIDVPSDEKHGARLPHYNATAKNLVGCAEKSLRLMGIDVIDLFLVHRPDWLTPAEETAAGLRELLGSGKVKHVGVSNYTFHQFATLDALMDGALVTNQVEFSPLVMGAMDDGTLLQCERLGIRPMAWSPLAGGRLFDAGDPAAVRVRAAFAAMRERYDGADDAALAFAWVMAHPARPVPVLGTNKLARVQSTAAAAAIAMERQDWYAVWEAAAGQSVP